MVLLLTVKMTFASNIDFGNVVDEFTENIDLVSLYPRCRAPWPELCFYTCLTCTTHGPSPLTNCNRPLQTTIPCLPSGYTLDSSLDCPPAGPPWLSLTLLVFPPNTGYG